MNTDKIIEYLLELLEDREQKIHDLEGANKQAWEAHEAMRNLWMENQRKVVSLEECNANCHDVMNHLEGEIKGLEDWLQNIIALKDSQAAPQPQEEEKAFRREEDKIAWSIRHPIGQDFPQQTHEEEEVEKLDGQFKQVISRQPPYQEADVERWINWRDEQKHGIDPKEIDG